ncbi:hypothetical protein PS723_00161 [Pseudomonas fluorescens]|uniref:Uncharacterized protein n=1 Tax=Pseudomonas fluorescens TaxID=294 RepID=A0A5E6ZMN7_PSEFL|nr:hypothetical protein PS723_00161 [Pseudomonas fluorescens]
MDAAAQASATTHAKTSTWVLVFIFCFLGLLIDGADLMLLSYSLSSLKTEFGLSNVEAGSLDQRSSRACQEENRGHPKAILRKAREHVQADLR